MFFNARAAKALAPGEYIVVEGCPGLRLNASETRKTWTYRFRSPVDNALRQVRIGHWPSMAPAEAVAEWQALRDQRAGGEDPALSKKKGRADKTAAAAAVETKAYTLGQMVEDYASGYLKINRDGRGAKAIAQRLRNALANGYAEIPAAETTRALAFRMIESLIATPVMAKSVKTEMAAAWRYAMESGRVPDDLPNWWAEKTSHKFRSKGAMRDGKLKGTGKRVLNHEELKTLLREDLGLFSTQVSRFLEFQLWTCTRGAEICQMRRHQLSVEGDVLWWTVPKEDMKGRHVENAFDLRVPLFGRARQIAEELLAEVPADVPWLFPSTSRAGVIRGQTQAYMQSKVHYMQPYSKSKPKHIRRRLQVTHWSPHDLRRTGRTMLAAMGAPHEIGEAILGHVLAGVAGDYNLYRYDAERKLWLKRLSDQLAGFAPAAG